MKSYLPTLLIKKLVYVLEVVDVGHGGKSLGRD